jgi:hypothetical protein
METTSPSYRITAQSGTIVADNLPRSAPAIQLHEGIVSKGDVQPMALTSGESSIVAYPLVEGRLICRVTRIDGIDLSNIKTRLIVFVEPDPGPKKSGTKAETKPEEQPIKVRRGRGKNMS